MPSRGTVGDSPTMDTASFVFELGSYSYENVESGVVTLRIGIDKAAPVWLCEENFAPFIVKVLWFSLPSIQTSRIR